MLKKYLSLMLALCLLLTASSVAYMEEAIENDMLMSMELTSDMEEASIEEGAVLDLGGAETAEVPEAAEPETAPEAEAPAEDTAPAEVPETVEETADESAKLAVAEGAVSEFLLTKNAKHSVNVGDSFQINLNGLTAKKYASSKKKVATVNASGLVTAVGGGKTKITVTITKKKKLTLTLTVVDPTKPTKVYLTRNGAAVSGTITANKGEPLTLAAVAQPEGTAVTGFKWSSSNKKIATVNGSGVITPKKEGKATITVKATKGGKTAKIKVKVVDPYKATKVSLEPSGFSYMTVGGTLQLEATMTPLYSTSTLKWSTSNKKVATVSKTGLVKAKKVGKAKITVKTSSGKKASITIQVLKKAGNAKSVFIDMVSDEFLYVGEPKYIPAYTDPINATASIEWSSSNPDIVQVWETEHTGDLKWFLTAYPKAVGSCTLTARDTVSGQSYSINVTVLEPPVPESIAFPNIPGSVTMNNGTSTTVEYQVNPGSSLNHVANQATVDYDSNIVDISYRKNNYKYNGLCTMDYNLVITAKNPGTTTVTVRLANGVSGSFTVTVQ